MNVGKHMLIFVLLLSFCILPVNSSALLRLQQGDVPLDINLRDIGGNAINVSESFGKKPVLLLFWELTTDASFLNYSLEELKFIQDYYEEYHDDHGLEVFGIYTPEEETTIPEKELSVVKSLIEKNNITFPILIDEGFRIFRKYGVIALPTTVMIGRSGKINFIYPSFPVTARQEISYEIKKLVGIAEAREEQEEKRIKAAGSRAERLYFYALQMVKRNHYKQALSPLQKSVELNPDLSKSHNIMGILHWDMDSYGAALREFERAVEIDGGNKAAHFNAGLHYFANKSYKKALQYFENALRTDDSEPELNYMMGLVHWKMDRDGSALNELKKTLDLLDKEQSMSGRDRDEILRVSSLYIISRIYSDRNDNESAVKMLRSAVETILHTDGSADIGIPAIGRLFMYE